MRVTRRNPTRELLRVVLSLVGIGSGLVGTPFRSDIRSVELLVTSTFEWNALNRDQDSGYHQVEHATTESTVMALLFVSIQRTVRANPLLWNPGTLLRPVLFPAC